MLRNSKKRKVKLRKSKKQKVTEEEAPINKLPDAVLVKILSLLPTEEAFRTCVISKKWQTLSTLIYSFNFNCSEYREREDLSFIHNALEHSRSSKIEKFELDLTECMDLCQLDYNLKFDFDFLVNRCCRFAVKRNVENLVLGLYSPEECPLPESLYTCSSLITLDVTLCCGFINDAVISWNSLKSITLGYVVFTDEDMVKLLSGCPSLETMELYRYDGFRRVEINSSTLKTLKLIDYGIPGVGYELDGVSGVRDELEIIAPYLQNLEISGDFLDVKCKLVDVSSLVNAKINYNNKCINHIPNVNEEHNCRDYHQVLYSLIQENLQKLCYATELTIGNWFTQVMCMLQFKRIPVSDFYCKYLTLQLHMKKFNLYGVAGFLRASPHVETLNIDMQTMELDVICNYVDNSRCNSELRDLAKGDNMDLQNCVSSLEFHNLKNVKIVISSKLCLKYHVKWGFKKLFKLSKFLLINASVLEKFIIISKRSRCETCSGNCLSKYLFLLAFKLLDCPRSSTNSVIIFQE
ncbi:putative F-box protein At1g49610 [Solanum stenotomum]|uniref:putative F-box protein At1g49610 n=1 Tax=Solanum stenotomum TaxID=172797 RepID=UPI0020D09938|nr:putative F-box protein At1g49610 [Solanum stenotomum]